MLVTFRLTILAVAIITGPAGAQSAPRELRARMDLFVRALSAGDRQAGRIASFFPRHSPLTIERAPDPSGLPSPVLRRVLYPDSVRAELEDRESCAFGAALYMLSDRWRYSGAGRFAPLTREGSDILYVDWAPEDGVWVVRQITVAHYTPRPVLGTAVGEMSRDTASYAWLPEERRYAVHTNWYRENDAITVAGRRIVKYGLPRSLGRHELELIGTLGVVPVFMEKGGSYPPEVVYVLVGSGEYQPYQDDADTVEDICGQWW